MLAPALMSAPQHSMWPVGRAAPGELCWLRLPLASVPLPVIAVWHRAVVLKGVLAQSISITWEFVGNAKFRASP